MRLLSLCTGYGGLDLAVEAFFDCELVACAEIDKYASLAIDKHFGVPNVGDIKQLNWASLGDIDIITAGYPCQPFSHAGQRKGTEDERHIWPYIKKGIGILRPSLVILENVRGHLSLGFKEVLQELTEIGYDAVWTVVRASDVGAPHQRARLFIIAQPSDTDSERHLFRELREARSERQSQCESASCCKNVTHSTSARLEGSFNEKHRFECRGETTTDTDSNACEKSRRADRSLQSKTSEIEHWSNRDEHWCGCKTTSNTDRNEQQGNRQVQGLGRRFDTRDQMRLRTTPNPLDLDGKLNPVFVEYMMGLPEGWVTDLPISRAQKLKMLGNGVVPQQAYYALEKLWHMRHAV